MWLRLVGIAKTSYIIQMEMELYIDARSPVQSEMIAGQLIVKIGI